MDVSLWRCELVFTNCPQANHFICNLVSLYIKWEYRNHFSFQEHSEQKELMFVRSQIAQLGKEDEKMHNYVLEVLDSAS